MHREQVIHSLEKLITAIIFESLMIASIYFYLMLFWTFKLIFNTGNLELVANQIRYCAKGLGVTYLISLFSAICITFINSNWKQNKGV